jgi:hypothetical protein
LANKELYTVNEAAFDDITEESSYWLGFFKVDGCIFKEKTGNALISLTLREADYQHLVKFSRFLNCSYQILKKTMEIRGKTIIHYTLSFSSKHIAEI